MDDQLKTLLRAKADEMRLPHEMPSSLRRRAHRRRAGAVTTISVVLLALALGSYVGWRSLSQNDVGRLVPATEGAGERDVVFPNPKAIEGIQRAAEAGSAAGWFDPKQVARRFAVDALRWEGTDTEIRLPGDNPVTTIISNPSLAGPMADVRTILTMERWQGREDGIYVVTRVDAEILDLRSPQPGQTVTPGEELTFEGELRGISQRLLGLQVIFRVQGGFASPFQEPANLAEETMPPYGPGSGPLQAVDAGSVGIIPEADGHFRVSIELGGKPPSDAILAAFIRTAEDDVLTSEIFRLGVATAAQTPSGETGSPEPPAQKSAHAFVKDFMNARIAGRSADAFLSAEAAQQYEQDPSDRLSLHSPTSNPHYADFKILSVQAADANSYEVLVRIIEETWPEPGERVDAFKERLFVGPGTNIEGETLPNVIRGVQIAMGT